MAATKKKKITLDLGEWEWGEWPNELASALEAALRVSVDTTDGITINIACGGSFAAAVKRIAVEAIGEFLNGSDLMAYLDGEGVAIVTGDLDYKPVHIPWRQKHALDGAIIVPRSGNMVKILLEAIEMECEMRGVAFPPSEQELQTWGEHRDGTGG